MLQVKQRRRSPYPQVINSQNQTLTIVTILKEQRKQTDANMIKPFICIEDESVTHRQISHTRR